VSLLMDALKRAEQAKRQSQEGSGTTPAEGGQGPAQAKPALTLELLDDELGPPPATPAAPAADDARQREAARHLFDAKQPPSRRPFYLVLGISTTAAMVAIGIHFWLQLQPARNRQLTAAAPPPAAVAPLPAAPATSAPASQSPLPAAATPLGADLAPRAALPAKPAEPVRPLRPAAPKPVREEPAPVRISKSKIVVNPVLNQAYQAFQAGRVDAAQRGYEQVLKTEPENADALLGMAMIALQQARPDVAERYFLAAAESDPKNATAQAGLAGLRQQSDPVQLESRLKVLLTDQPDSPPLNFALGNVYARQGRWNEAQQAYFRAFAGDGDNPDYLFNLAVALDHLRQPKLALQYYQKALAAADIRPAGFDRTQAAGRIRDLQQ
jgi:tetratricopeptide (TPR) repeat protein